MKSITGLWTRAFGAIIFLVGVAFLFVGPLEIYCFYLFSPGGRFHYDGFGVGSLMFANVAAQIVGYYAIGITGIVLGYGHLTLRPWTRPLILTVLWSWIVAGIPLTMAALWVFADTKDPSPTGIVVALALGLVVYPVAPAVLVYVYSLPSVATLFARRDPSPSRLERVPLPVRVLCLLFAGYIVALHLLLLLRGVFPFFGVLLSDIPGFIAIDALVLVLIALIWGLALARPWAWWGSLATFALLAVSALLTLPRYSLREVMATMRLPDSEIAMLSGLPFLDSPITLPVLLPLLVTLGAIVFAGRAFFSWQRSVAASADSG